MSGHLRIRRATPADCRMYWEWANEEAVRAASFSSEPIPWETHVAWFEKRVEAPDCRLYLACDPSGRPVGQVRYELEGDEAIVSISVPAEHRGKGVAREALALATQRLFAEMDARRIAALIRPDNAASLRLFEWAGYAPAGETAVNGQRAVKMVLSREV